MNGSSSAVLTATPHSYGRGQNSTPYKIKTPEWIGMKFGTVDYVLEISTQNKFGDDRSSGGCWVNMWNIRCLLLSLFFFPNVPKVVTQISLKLNISITVRDTWSVHINYQQETTHWESSGHVTHGKPQIFARFHLNISGLISKHPLFFIGAP